MKEKPILFSAPMVRAILAGAKTMTRRVIDGRLFNGLTDFVFDGWAGEHVGGIAMFHSTDREWTPQFKCPYGQPGDRLWVRETWAPFDEFVIPEKDTSGLGFAADEKWQGLSPDTHSYNWRPSIHMPRWASRITLEVTDVRVERVQDITEEDAAAEGFEAVRVGGRNKNGVLDPPMSFYPATSREQFQKLWDTLNAKRGFGWDVNPWVWVVSFKRVQP